MEESVSRIFPAHLRTVIGQVPKPVMEIRMRVGQPFSMILEDGREYEPGLPETKLAHETAGGIVIKSSDIRETMERVSNYSLYAYEEELRQGYITIPGGHRVGMAGRVICENGRIKGMKYLSSINVRVAREVRGCGDRILPWLFDQNRELQHTLIVSPPRKGKTTLLRDLIRQISDRGYIVGVADERSEIGACYQGIPQNDLGKRTDVMDACPKAEGMMMLIRTMAPQVVAVDEIGSAAETQAMEYAMNCGCRILATVHGSSFEELHRKPIWQQLMQEHWFERYILLKNIGEMVVCDRMERKLWQSC